MAKNPTIPNKSAAASNYRLSAIDAETSKWEGYPDPDYSWDGDRLSFERTVKDEDGKDVTVKTYREPIEIIANFKSESKVFGIEGNIEKNAVKKFGGSLKGFVWLDSVSGGGEVILPFTAKHIFIARGDKLNPVLTEIGTEGDDCYEIIEGKTLVHVKSFSGIGGAAGSPLTLIAHYKFNEDTASDNDELVTNGVAPTDLTGWTQAPGTQWSIVGNKFQGAGNSDFNFLYQYFGVVVGSKYSFSYEVTDNSLVGGTEINQIRLSSTGTFGLTTLSSSVGTHTYYLLSIKSVTANLELRMYLNSTVTGGTIDLDNISIKLLVVEDSSGNDHNALAQQATDQIHRTGKINGAFDFNGSSDFIIIPDHDDFTPAGTPFSISAWGYMHNATHFDFASKGVYNTDGEWIFHTNSADKLLFRAFDESVADCFIGQISDDALTAYADSWVHFVVTYDGGILSSGIKLYLNANLLSSSANQNNNNSFVAIENLTSVVKIGADGSDNADGLIDNVMFFSVELSQDDVIALYNNGHGTEILSEIDSERRFDSRSRR